MLGLSQNVSKIWFFILKFSFKIHFLVFVGQKFINMKKNVIHYDKCHTFTVVVSCSEDAAPT